MKRRYINDTEVLGVTACTRRQYKAVLPRQADLVPDTLSLTADAQSAGIVMLLVLDAPDAYWQVPLHPADRRFYCSKLQLQDRCLYLAYQRNTQG